MDNWKKWLIGIVCFLIIGVTIALIWINKDAIKSNTQVYTVEQMEESYNKGFEAGVKDRAELVLNINKLNSENADYKARIKELEPLASENTSLRAEIEALNKQIAENEKAIEYYESLMQYVDTSNFCYINFYVDNEVYESVLLAKNEILPDFKIPVVEKWGYKFQGWIFEDNTAVDFTTQTFDKTTNVYASFKELTALETRIPFAVYGYDNDSFTNSLTIKIEAVGLKAGDLIHIQFNRIDFAYHDVTPILYYSLLNNNAMVLKDMDDLYDANLYKFQLRPGEKISYKDNMYIYNNNFELSVCCTEDGYLDINIVYEDSSFGPYFIIDRLNFDSKIYIER